MVKRPVAVGVDGSPESLAAAEWAAGEAALRGLALCIVHASDGQTGGQRFFRGAAAQRDWEEAQLRRAWRRAGDRHPGLVIAANETADTPAEVLLDAARESELLVLGSSGLGGLAGFLVGSVGLTVISRARRPVVVVRGEARLEEDEGRPVVVGLDFRRPCGPLIDFAFETAAVRGSTLRVVHAWSRDSLYASPSALLDPAAGAGLESRVRQELEDVLSPLRERFPAVGVDERLASGSAGRQIVEAGADASLLIVGRRNRTAAAGAPIGPVTQAVLHHAARPVAVVPHA
ncbi:universal stress protein [Streptomyces sp. 8N616]|uniref:universal stress protein n=1 Tax=Streptomyces sp. 8N616 TaxID=3457414 RepID=UPI003FD488CA